MTTTRCRPCPPPPCDTRYGPIEDILRQRLENLTWDQLQEYLLRAPGWALAIVEAELARRQAAGAEGLVNRLPAADFGSPAHMDINVYRGDTGAFQLNVTQDDLPVDVATATWDCDIRDTEDSTIVLASMEVTPVSGTPNAIDVTLSAQASATLQDMCIYDLEMTLDGVVTTLLRGHIYVQKDVSRTEPG